VLAPALAETVVFKNGGRTVEVAFEGVDAPVERAVALDAFDKLVALTPEFSDTEVAVALEPDPTEAVALSAGAAPVGITTIDADLFNDAVEEPTVALAPEFSDTDVAVAFEPDPTEAVALRAGAAPLGTTTTEAVLLNEADKEGIVALAPKFLDTEVAVALEPNPTEAVALRIGVAPLGTTTDEAAWLNEAGGEPAVALAPEFLDTEVALDDTDSSVAVSLNEAAGEPAIAVAEAIAVMFILPPAMAEATTEELIFEAIATGQIVYR
jgi:hypothetical protein